MAKRLTTRLSAGAALVTGLGMVGIATAVPANAATTIQYSCTTPLGPQVLDVSLDTDAPEEAAVGDEISITPSGTVTLNPAIANGMAGALQWEDVEGDIPNVAATISNGTDSAEVTTDLTIDRTKIYDGDNGGWTDPEVDPADPKPTLPISGSTETATVSAEGEYTLTAPDTFNATFRGYNADGEAGTGSPIESECTFVEGSGSKTIDTITVTEEGPGDDDGETPETNDWFTEPQSLPIDEDNVVTLEGTASQAGTITVEVLGEGTDDAGEPAPGEVLESHTFEVEAGDVSETFPLVEGAGYARVISQDCVDANGDDETIEGSGCNVTYKASWVDGGDGGNDDGSGGDDDNGAPVDDGDDNADDGAGDGDDATGDPEVPEVVQTDGFTPVGEQPQDNTLALTLGGLLLAGAGAGTVLVARRRAATQR